MENHGILSQVTKAKEQTEIASEKEQIQMAYTEANMSGTNILLKTKEVLDETNKYNVSISGNEIVIITKKGNRVYEINNSTVEYIGITEVISENEPIMKIGRYWDTAQAKEVKEAFWEDSIRENISEIETKCYIIKPNNIIEEWDISEKKDKSVLAWIVDDGNAGYKLTIAGNGKIKLRSCSQLFDSFTKVKKISAINLDTSMVTEMNSMFARCTLLEKIDIKGLDTSNVTSMVQMFRNLNNMETIDLSDLNTGKVVNMAYMLSDSGFVDLDLSTFDTSNVTNMQNMFQYDNKLKSINFNGWNTSKVNNMNEMFRNYGNSQLKILDFSEFDISKVNSYNHMLEGLKSDISIYTNTSNIDWFKANFQEYSSNFILK